MVVSKNMEHVFLKKCRTISKFTSIVKSDFIVLFVKQFSGREGFGLKK